MAMNMNGSMSYPSQTKCQIDGKIIDYDCMSSESIDAYDKYPLKLVYLGEGCYVNSNGKITDLKGWFWRYANKGEA